MLIGTRCRYEFCWVCLADYKKIRKSGNQMHRNTCAYYVGFDDVGIVEV